MTVNVLRGFDGRNSLPMKSPYSGSMRMWSVASGAGAYSHGFSPAARPHEAGAGRLSGFLVSVIATDYRIRPVARRTRRPTRPAKRRPRSHWAAATPDSAESIRVRFQYRDLRTVLASGL